MTSLRQLAATGDAESFAAAYTGSADADLLFAALTNRDPDARAAIAGQLIADGADAAAVQEGQSTLSVLLGAHQRLGAGDGELAQRLVDAGADVNFREWRGELVLHLAAKTRAADDEDRRSLYQAFFSSPQLDLSLPVNESQDKTIGQWLHGTCERVPDKRQVLAEFLAAAG